MARTRAGRPDGRSNPRRKSKPHVEAKTTFQGLPVIDANADFITVPFRKTFIRKSVPRSTMECIAALAARDHPDVVHTDRHGSGVRVGGRFVIVRFAAHPGVWVRHWLNGLEKSRIDNFDRDGKAIKSAETWLVGQTMTFSTPPPSLRLHYKSGQSGTNKRRKKKDRQRKYPEPCLRNLRWD